MPSTSTSGQLAKAKITNLDTNAAVTCMFNPDKYTFTKNNKWETVAIKGSNIPNLEFQGGSVGTLSLDLIFDTNEKHDSINTAGEDVRTYTTPLWNMMAISSKRINSKTKKGDPPSVRFEWGSLWSFTAVILSISETFTFFKADGTPLRAEVKVTFRQLGEKGRYPKQNPTSGGNPGEHLRTVIEGETLVGIAYEEYGDATVWRHLADSNNIADPRRLRPGQVLLITPLPIK